MPSNFPTGFIVPSQRTNAQVDAATRALAKMPKFAINATLPTGPVKVMLTDFWKRPEVVADIGFEFNGFHQLTGSCVGASGGNAGFTLSAVQRCLAENPTKAYVPYWPHAYGLTRFAEGDRGQGEGAVDSVMGETLHRVGVLESTHAGLPQFQRTADGLVLTEAVEMQWSDGGRIDPKWLPLALPQTVGTVAPLSGVQDIRLGIVNGYPCLNGCAYYVGNGRVVGSGANAYVAGHYDAQGGHSTCFLGYWDHPTDGPLYLYSNQWPTSVYPTDPAGGGRCCVWIKEAEVEKLFRNGGDNGETMALSHLNYFPAQPKVLDWFIAP